MTSRLLTAVACVLTLALPLGAQTPAPIPPLDGVGTLLDSLRVGLIAADEAALLATLSDEASPDALQFTRDLVQPGVDIIRALVVERDRRELEGESLDNGHSLTVEFYTETASRARIVTARVDVVRPEAGDASAWRVVSAEQLTDIEGLYRLALNVASPYTAANLTLNSEDLEISLPSGTVFEVDSADGVTGLVLLGRGTMRFAPRLESEQTQMRIFAGTDALDTEFDSAFIRLSPTEYERQVPRSALQPTVASQNETAAAQAMFAEETPKSYSLDLGDLSPEVWYLLPQTGDFVAEVRTRDHDTLTFARTIGQAEDVILFDRLNTRTIALYASEAKLQTRGRFYTEDDAADYDIIDHALDANIRFISGPRTPRFPYIEGTSRLTLRVRTHLLATLTLRLANELNVEGIASIEHGRLLYLRLRDQNSVIVDLPSGLPEGSELTLLVAYSGPLRNETLDNYAVVQGEVRADARVITNDNIFPFYPPEPNLLLSSRSYWYPQGPVSDYATATLRISLPEGYGAVASGELQSQSLVARSAEDESDGVPAMHTSVFRASTPIRYLSVIVSRLDHISDSRVTLPVAPGEDVTSIILSIDANPRQDSEARNLVGQASDILQFYSELMGVAPYSSLSIALVESGTPGGHSPAYATMLNQPVPGTPFRWNNDPAAMPDFPEFFLAHEIAHQWWGQSVGWKNYHEQWLSEGFAQYFSALYAEHLHGNDAFDDMIQEMGRWALRESDEGPIYLGYRLGHLRREGRVFRALVYNKSALVLHMLRRLVGDEAFFGGLRRYYGEYAFSKAGTDDFRRVMEAESGLELSRFFERWIYSAGIPRVQYSTAPGPAGTIVRLEQLDGPIYDIPVTLDATYSDGRTESVTVSLTDRTADVTLTGGAIRRLDVNADGAALGVFTED
jgi:hypothetical protein